MEVGSLPNHVNSCVLCVCLLFNFCLFTVIDLSPGVLSAQQDVYPKHMRRRGIQKYLRESCYHRIECTTATFLTAFMWRRPLNSATLATTTHRKPKRVFDGIGTQIRAQMTNKCRMKMVQRELYNVRDPQWGNDRKNREKEHCSNQNALILCLVDLYEHLPPRIKSSFISVLFICAWLPSNSILAVVQFIRA